MGWNEFGTALDDWISSLGEEKKRKQGLGAIGTLEKERDANDQYQGAQKRTDEWLASLSPEDLKRVRPDSTRVASNFEGIGDVKNFDLDKRKRQLGLTSEFSTLPEVQNYIKMNDVEKKNKLNTDISADLQKAAKAISDQRGKQEEYDNYKQIEELGNAGKLEGYKPGTPIQKPLSNREIFQSSGLNKYDDPRIKDFYEQNVKDQEDAKYKEDVLGAKTTKNEKSPFNMVGARIKYDTPEYRELINSQIDDSLAGGSISQEQADFAKSQVNNGFAYDYGLSFMKNGVDASLKRGIKVADEYALNVPQAAGAAANTEATEKKKREIQAGNPILSEAQGGALSDAYNAVNYLNTLKNAIKNNNLGYFDIDRKTGQFVNPEAGDAFLQLVEIVGRKRSGAAISDSEWKSFGKQVLNKNNLLTDAGKKTAIEGLDRYLDKFYGAGVTTTGNEDWYNNYKSKSKSARQKAEGTTEPPPVSATDKLKDAAKSGNAKAQAYLKSKGVSW